MFQHGIASIHLETLSTTTATSMTAKARRKWTHEFYTPHIKDSNYWNWLEGHQVATRSFAQFLATLACLATFMHIVK